MRRLLSGAVPVAASSLRRELYAEVVLISRHSAHPSRKHSIVCTARGEFTVRSAWLSPSHSLCPRAECSDGLLN